MAPTWTGKMKKFFPLMKSHGVLTDWKSPGILPKNWKTRRILSNLFSLTFSLKCIFSYLLNSIYIILTKNSGKVREICPSKNVGNP